MSVVSQCKESSAAKVALQYNDPSADIDLISSDGVIFKIYARQLQSSSEIFRDMLEVQHQSGIQAIELVDPDLENSSVILFFLLLVINRETIQAAYDQSLDYGDLINLISFAEKYECHQLLEDSISDQWTQVDRLRQSHIHQIKPEAFPEAFVIASRLGSSDMAKEVILVYSYRKLKWKGRTSLYIDISENIAGMAVMDPASWGFELVNQVPLEFYHGLNRAIALGRIDNPTDPWKSAADHFLGCMRM